ncbi:MAG: pirin family protein [Pseudomonadota bacterium]
MATVTATQDPGVAPVPAAALRVRRADARGQADFGWLTSAHSFSFGNYHDPAHMQFANLRVINDDHVSAGKGFGAHPHRDAEIFSYVVAGALEHRDSLGNGSVVGAGGVQYMSAGRGVVHSEFNPSDTDPVRFLQVWLMPDQLGGEPRYDTLDIDPSDKDGKLALFLSRDGRNGSMRVQAQADVYAATLSGSQQITHTLAPGRAVWIQVVNGSVAVNDTPLRQGDGLAVSAPGSLTLHTGVSAEILLFDLEAA